MLNYNLTIYSINRFEMNFKANLKSFNKLNLFLYLLLNFNLILVQFIERHLLALKFISRRYQYLKLIF